MINSTLPRGYETTDMPRYEHSPVPHAVVTDQEPRCWRCRRKLAEHVSRPWSLVCSRCKAQNASQPTC